jgi:hypothetical protein
MFIHPTGSHTLPVVPPERPLSKSEGFTHFQCRLSCLITYFASMILANKMDLSTFLPKEGAPFFAGHKDQAANLFSPDPTKAPEELSQDFLKAIESRLGPYLTGRKKIIRQIHKWGNKLVLQLTTRALDDIESLLKQITDSTTPEESNTKLLKMIKDLVAPVFDIYGQSREEPPPTPKEGTTPLTHEEKALLEEQLIFEVMGHGFDPHANLLEVATQYQISLNLQDPAIREFVRKELPKMIKIAGATIPDNWPELQILILDQFPGEEGLNLIYKLQKSVLNKSIETFDPYATTQSLETIDVILIELEKKGIKWPTKEFLGANPLEKLEQFFPEYFEEIARSVESAKKTAAFRRLPGLKTKQQRIWNEQVEISLSKMTREQRAKYDAKLEESMARTQSNQERLKLLKVRETMSSELDKGIQEITLKHLEPYGCDSIADLEKALLAKIKRKHLNESEEVISHIFKNNIREFYEKLQPEIDRLVGRLYIVSEKKSYENLCRAVSSKFTYMGDTSLDPTLKKTRKRYTNWSQKASSNPLQHLGHCLIGGLLAFLTLISSGCNELFQRSWNKIKGSIASEIMTPITEGIFGGILNMLMQTGTVRGSIFGAINYFTEHLNDPPTLAADGTPITPPSAEEIRQAGELFDTVFHLLERSIPHKLKMAFGFNIFDFLKGSREQIAIQIAQQLRAFSTNKTKTKAMLESTLSSLPEIFDNWDAVIVDNELLRAKARKEEYEFHAQNKAKLIQYAIDQGIQTAPQLATSYMPKILQRGLDTIGSVLGSWLPPFWAKRDEEKTVSIGPNLALHTISLATDMLEVDELIRHIITTLTDSRSHRSILFSSVHKYTQYLQDSAQQYQERMQLERRQPKP